MAMINADARGVDCHACDFVLLWREHATRTRRRLHTTIRSVLFVQLSTRLERDWVLARGVVSIHGEFI